MNEGYNKIGEEKINVDIFMHSQRVAIYTKEFVRSMGYNAEQIEYIVMTALNHDIGKCMINHDILNKKGKLTSDEFYQMKKHTDYGAEILKIYSGYRYMPYIIKMHHENYDGSGYHNVRGDYIPIEARIIRIMDVYDALTSERCYRNAYAKEDALSIMEAEKHKYDIKLLEHFFKIMNI